MKSSKTQIAIDVLTFPWDRNASASSATRQGISSDADANRSFELYFEFLEEVKPHPDTLRRVRVFEQPFTL